MIRNKTTKLIDEYCLAIIPGYTPTPAYYIVGRFKDKDNPTSEGYANGGALERKRPIQILSPKFLG